MCVCLFQSKITANYAEIPLSMTNLLQSEGENELMEHVGLNKMHVISRQKSS